MNERDDATEVWAEVAAAVGHLREAGRSGLTVWDALIEGLALWAADDWSQGPAGEAQLWTDPDPLRTKLEMLLRTAADPLQPDGHSVAAVFDAALRVWIDDARTRHNDGRPFTSQVRSVWSSDSTVT